MESPENKMNVRVLRNRVVKEANDGLSTPSKLGTPSKRGTPSKVTSEASGITTRTRRRLSTRLENEIPAEVPEPRLVMNKLQLNCTPSKRGDRNVGERDKSPEITTRSTQKNSKKNEMSPTGTKENKLSVSSPQNRRDLLKDQSSPIVDKKSNGHLPIVLENGEDSDPPEIRKGLLENQSSPIADKKAKGDLPPILENGEDSDNSIVENSFQLELDVTDKTKNELQITPSKKSPLIDKSPDKSNREDIIKSVSDIIKTVSDLGHLERIESDEQNQNKASGLESIVLSVDLESEEESIKCIDQEKLSNKSVDKEEECNKSVNQGKEASKSAEQGKESSESDDQDVKTNKSVDQGKEASKSAEQGKESSESGDQAEECNKSVNQEEEETKFPNQVENSSESDDQDKKSNKSVDQGKEASKSAEQGKESSESGDQAEECNKSVNQEEEETRKFPNQVENSSESSLEKECRQSINFKKVPSEIVIPVEGSDPADQGEESSQTILIEEESIQSFDQVNESSEPICPEECNVDDSTSNDILNTENISIVQSTRGSSPSKKHASNSEGNTNVVDGIGEPDNDNISLKGNNPINICLEDESKSNDVSFELVDKLQDNSAVNTLHDDVIECFTDTAGSTVPDQLECKKLSESSPCLSPMKRSNSPKSSPSIVCRKNSSSHETNKVTSPFCQRLPTEKISPSKASYTTISPSSQKVVSDKRILDSDSDSDDSDLPQEIPSKDISPKKSTLTSDHSDLPQEIPSKDISLKKSTLTSDHSDLPQEIPSKYISPKKSTLTSDHSDLPQEIPSKDTSPKKSTLTSDDSDSPQEIPSKDISPKKSPQSTDNEDFTIKSTPSPNKVLKLIKPIQAKALYKLNNLVKSAYESQPIPNAFNTLDESRKETSSDSDELRISRKELTLIMKEAINDALVGLRKDVLQIRKELSDLRGKEEEEKAKKLKEENMEECSVLAKRKKELVVEHLLAKQAAQIFSDCDSKKKKSPKKNKESTQVLIVDEEKAVQSNNSGSESCSTLTHQPKLKNIKMIEVQGEEEEKDDDLDVELRRKYRKRRRKTESTVEKTEEAIVPTQDVEPVELSNNSEDHVDESELKPKKKRNRRHKNKDQETPLVESTNHSQVKSSDAADNDLPKKSKKQQPQLLIENSNEDCMNVDNFDNQTINVEKKEKKHKKKAAEKMVKLSSENVFSPNLDRNELFEQQPLTEGKKKKKKHVEQTDELNQQHLSPENVELPNLKSTEQQPLNEVKKKKKKHVERTEELNHHHVSPENVVLPNLKSTEQQPLNEVKKKKKKRDVLIDQLNRHSSPKNITSPNQNPSSSQLFKIKKQKLKKNLKPKSNYNISQHNLKSYMEEFCDLKHEDKVKLNSYEDLNNEVLKSKDSKKLKTKKKNKGSVNNSFEIETGKKDVKHSKKQAKDTSHKLTPSTTLDVTNFWL